MLQHLKPTDEEIEQLALAETDMKQAGRFSPLRYGPAGNLAVILAAGSLGMAHALAAAVWRHISPAPAKGRDA
jgi:hypothetical protein